MREPAIDQAVQAPGQRGAARRRPRRAGTRVVLESALIVASVLLGFGLNEWRLRQEDRALARNVLKGMRQEIEANLSLLERYQPMHREFAEAIAATDPAALEGRAPFEVLSSLRSDGGGSLIMPPGHAAWQTAVSTGALRLLDYETAARLSRIYHSQTDAVGRTSERLADVVFHPQMFDRSSTLPTLRTLLALLGELAAQEEWLMNEYRSSLARLDSLGV